MTKREQNLGIVIFALAMVWFVAMVSSPPKKGTAKRPVAVKTAPAASQAQGTQNQVSEEIRFLVEQLVLNSNTPDEKEILDPFRRLDKKESGEKSSLELSDLVLSGIMTENSGDVVIINDQLYKEGEQIAEFRIEEIHSNEVILSRGIEKYSIRLFTDPE